MKYYKLKENNIIIYCWEEIFNSNEEALKFHKGGIFSEVGDYKNSKCISIEKLRQEIFEQEFKHDVNKSEYPKCWKLVDEIIERAGIETFEINYPDCPCIIVKCEELGDQYECDADRIPFCYLKSAKEIETKQFNFPFEVWLIKKNGSLKCEKNLGTYIMEYC